MLMDFVVCCIKHKYHPFLNSGSFHSLKQKQKMATLFQISCTTIMTLLQLWCAVCAFPPTEVFVEFLQPVRTHGSSTGRLPPSGRTLSRLLVDDQKGRSIWLQFGLYCKLLITYILKFWVSFLIFKIIIKHVFWGIKDRFRLAREKK